MNCMLTAPLNREELCQVRRQRKLPIVILQTSIGATTTVRRLDSSSRNKCAAVCIGVAVCIGLAMEVCCTLPCGAGRRGGAELQLDAIGCNATVAYAIPVVGELR